MPRVVTARAGDAALSADMMTLMFRLRYEVFYKKLRWEVSVEDQQERDDFDQVSPWYMIAKGERESAGCWRLLPTVSPYMLTHTFPQLLRGEQPPINPDTWELSRFAVTSPAQRFQGQIYLSDLTYQMIEELIRFADRHNIENYVTVTSVAVERLMTRCGIPMIRFGDGESTLVGAVESVACWIPVNDTFRNAVRHATEALRTA